MSWLLLCATVSLTIAFVLIAWRKWIAPWEEVEELVTQIARGERPRTFLVRDGAQAQRIGLALEKIFDDLKQLDKQVAKRESGLQTIFSAMQDALLVVDSDRRVVLANDAFRKLFALPEISPGTPLLDSVRDATLDQVIGGAFGGGQPVRSELAVDGLQIELHAIATRNEAGEITGALVLFHEITELKKMDQVRRDFVANVSHDLTTIRADRIRLQEALYNLLDNAVKYSRERGEITLVARRREQQIVLSVSDNGIGISKDDLPRIFERFYRVDKARTPENIRGTGLGLAIVKHIAQLHGGHVEAESEIEKGTTIRVVLPIVTQT